MRKLFYAVILFFVVNQSVAQWVSPGNGHSYSLADLCVAAPSAVQTTGSQQYTILQNLTVSTGDTLTLESTAEALTIANDVTVTIYGTLRTAGRTQTFIIRGDSTQNGYFELRFEDAVQNNLSHIHIQYCQGVKLINSDMVIDSCEFDHFSGHVVSYMNCHPVIQNSYFHDNQKCAIQSAINTDGSPKILSNIFYNNVLDNANTPQINIGPGTTDTIQIVGNRIEGVASNMSGGIGIMNMSNPSVTKLLLKDNVILNNRYGYTQNGVLISSEIFDNQFIDNNLEVNPNNGGSGISIYGSDTTNAAKLRRNLITGNLWGVTAIYYHHLDMGTEDDYGYNLIYDNENNGIEYALFNNANSDMWAVGNYWGCDNAEEAEEVIYHQVDNDSYGLVHYTPVYVWEPEGIENTLLTNINFAPNPVTQGFFIMDNPTEENISWDVFNLTGACVMHGNAYPGSNTINTTRLQSGIYIVRLQQSGLYSSYKLIIQ